MSDSSNAVVADIDQTTRPDSHGVTGQLIAYSSNQNSTIDHRESAGRINDAENVYTSRWDIGEGTIARSIIDRLLSDRILTENDLLCAKESGHLDNIRYLQDFLIYGNDSTPALMTRTELADVISEMSPYPNFDLMNWKDAGMSVVSSFSTPSYAFVVFGTETPLLAEVDDSHDFDWEGDRTLISEPAMKYLLVLAKLHTLVGLDNIKTYVYNLTEKARLHSLRSENSLPDLGANRAEHIILRGNPGTGKTTVARLLGSAMQATGALPIGHVVEVSRADLVAYPGQTAIKTLAACEEALGGVLFIDEAYTLSSRDGVADDLGAEAINTILKFMEDHRGEFSVVAAGYPDEMDVFINQNPGLFRRFDTTLTLPDYTLDQLQEIFTRACERAEFELDGGVEELVRERLRVLAKDARNGNASASRKLFEEVSARMAKRVVDEADSAPEAPELRRKWLCTVVASDVDTIDVPTVEEVLARFDDLVGLAEVKKFALTLANQVRIAQKRKEEGLPVRDVLPHLVFSGSPGTGKTTVAQRLGELLHSLGVLPTSTVVEVDRAGLVANYVGQTASKTLERCKEALGGVLFIDEAYSLVDASREHNFGREAITTLLNFMEQHKGELVVVVAGYEKEMREFVESNPGLRSRFDQHIVFPDYTIDELQEVFVNAATRAGYQLEDGYEKTLESLLRTHASGTFGNARGVRQLLDRVQQRQEARITDELASGSSPNLSTLKIDDFKV